MSKKDTCVRSHVFALVDSFDKKTVMGKLEIKVM